MVAFALVVGLADGVGAQSGEGGQEHGSLEPLDAAMRDMFTSDGGARPSGRWCQSGVGGQVDSGAWSSLPRGSARKAAAGALIPSMEVSAR